MASVVQNGNCLHSKLPSWNSQELYPKARRMEKSWRSGEIWPQGNTHGQRCDVQQCTTCAQVWWGKNPSPCYFLRNRWNQGEPGHLKTTERFFLGFKFGQGEAQRQRSAPAQRSLALRRWFRWTQRQRSSLTSSPGKGVLPLKCPGWWEPKQ